ncbi:MAG: hypothetical protein GF341_07230 [candidate division Zixibacteria bacterium]|nr:hypothetical protein [candidate division Zixibacteria bacterium]
MKLVFTLMLCALVCGGMMGSSAQAEEPGDKMAHRWGIGWDDGLGLRYRLSEEWGVGLTVKPDLLERSQKSSRTVDSLTHVEPPREFNRRSMLAALMLYRETPISSWIDVGPFVRAQFSYDETENDYPGSPTTTHRLHAFRRLQFTIGIRPTFSYKDRFVLESRFGIGLSYYNSDYWSRAKHDQQVIQTTGGSDDWSGFTFGEELGPGSVLQFIIYF